MYVRHATPGAWQRRRRTWPTQVLPRLPVRQWVLSVPKRLRYFLQRDAVALNRHCTSSCALCSTVCISTAEGSSVSWSVRKGRHAHRHCRLHPPLWLQPEHPCAFFSLLRVDGRFGPVPGGHDDDAAQNAGHAQGVIFHTASGFDAAAVA